MSGAFPFFEFRGSSRDIGRQHGRQAGEIVHRHLDMALFKLEARGVDHSEARRRARLYIPFIEQYNPHFARELEGLAEGAEIATEDAYILQLRAELPVDPADESRSPALAASREAMANECTSFAVSGKHTVDGEPIAGQNADLPAGTRDLGIVVRIVPDDGRPAVLMLTPAGQISYIGINDRGLATFANFINTAGWRPGYPRYLLSRTVLEEDSIEAGLKRLATIPRASSRNLMIVDASGNAINLELAVQREGRLEPRDGLLTHSNHFICDEMLDEEQATGDRLQNSRIRLERMTSLLESNRGRISPELAMTFFRDRENAPDSICRHLGDGPDDYMTFASVIARPSLGELYVAPGPPDQHEYTKYTLDLAA